MSRQSAYPVLNETDPDPVIATPTGTTHILTVTVRSGNSFTISDSTLRIRNGDRVTWRLDSIDPEETPIVKFNGTVVRDNVSGTRGNRDVTHNVLKELKTDPLPEPYAVFLLAKNGTETKLIYESSMGARRDEDPPLPPEPYLMIDQIGDPPDRPKGPKDRFKDRRGPRRYRQYAK